MAKGFGGLPGNMQAIMQQAKKMQEQLKKAQDEAKDMQANGSSGGGMVEVTANGENQIVSINIKKEIVNPEDVEMLQDLILTACNNALTQVQKSVQEKLSSITGGMNLPGMF
jgi:DNA-binding YbaB/EbfC family protein